MYSRSNPWDGRRRTNMQCRLQSPNAKALAAGQILLLADVAGFHCRRAPASAMGNRGVETPSSELEYRRDLFACDRKLL